MLVVPFMLSILPFMLQFIAGLPGVILACIAFGIVLGMQESTYRAAISDMVPLGRRGSAYGYFNVLLGAGTFISGAAFGYMLDISLSPMIILAFVVISQAAAILLLWNSTQKKHEQA